MNLSFISVANAWFSMYEPKKVFAPEMKVNIIKNRSKPLKLPCNLEHLTTAVQSMLKETL